MLMRSLYASTAWSVLRILLVYLVWGDTSQVIIALRLHHMLLGLLSRLRSLFFHLTCLLLNQLRWFMIIRWVVVFFAFFSRLLLRLLLIWLLVNIDLALRARWLMMPAVYFMRALWMIVAVIYLMMMMTVIALPCAWLAILLHLRHTFLTLMLLVLRSSTSIFK